MSIYSISAKISQKDIIDHIENIHRNHFQVIRDFHLKEDGNKITLISNMQEVFSYENQDFLVCKHYISIFLFEKFGLTYELFNLLKHFHEHKPNFDGNTIKNLRNRI